MNHTFEALRKVRSRLVYFRGQPKYLEYVIGLPKIWVQAIAKELHIDPSEVYLKLTFDGDLLVKPVTEHKVWLPERKKND